MDFSTKLVTIQIKYKHFENGNGPPKDHIQICFWFGYLKQVAEDFVHQDAFANG